MYSRELNAEKAVPAARKNRARKRPAEALGRALDSPPTIEIAPQARPAEHDNPQDRPVEHDNPHDRPVEHDNLQARPAEQNNPQ